MKGIFFCDIIGTLTGKQDRENNIKVFCNNLRRIKEIDNLDTLYFSLISSNNLEEVMKLLYSFKTNLESEGITIGIQYADGKKNHFGKVINSSEGKQTQMIDAIRILYPDKIYYADDTLINQKVASHIIRKCLNLDVIPFIPGEDNTTKDISGLNRCLEKYVFEKTFERKIM